MRNHEPITKERAMKLAAMEFKEFFPWMRQRFIQRIVNILLKDWDTRKPQDRLKTENHIRKYLKGASK